METFFIASDWKERLKNAGLTDLSGCLKFSGGKVMSEHRRGRTVRTTLEDGSVIFVKTDNFTFKRSIVKSLLSCNRPLANSTHERAAYDLLRPLGFNVPQIPAWFTHTVLGLPGAAAMIMLPVTGTPLDRFLLEHQEDRELSERAVSRVEAEFRKMLEAGYDWKRDHKPEHFFITDDLEQVSIIDLERMSLKRQKLSPKVIEARLTRFREQAARFRKA